MLVLVFCLTHQALQNTAVDSKKYPPGDEWPSEMFPNWVTKLLGSPGWTNLVSKTTGVPREGKICTLPQPHPHCLKHTANHNHNHIFVLIYNIWVLIKCKGRFVKSNCNSLSYLSLLLRFFPCENEKILASPQVLVRCHKR